METNDSCFHFRTWEIIAAYSVRGIFVTILVLKLQGQEGGSPHKYINATNISFWILSDSWVISLYSFNCQGCSVECCGKMIMVGEYE